MFLNTSSDATLLRAALQAASAAGDDRPSDGEMLADMEVLGVERIFDGNALERI